MVNFGADSKASTPLPIPDLESSTRTCQEQCCPHPYGDFTNIPVGEHWFIYKDFTSHPWLEELDAFVSIAKMKCHHTAGFTHSMKNLVGVVPAASYRMESSHWWRSALHGPEYETRA